MKKIQILNPEDESELKKFNTIDIDMISVLKKYKNEQFNPVQICRVLYTENRGEIEDCCTLDYMMDLKNCVLTFPTMPQTKKTRPFVEQAISFARESGSAEVLIAINLDDLKTKKLLEEQEEFCGLPFDVEDGKILFIHEDANELVKSATL